MVGFGLAGFQCVDIVSQPSVHANRPSATVGANGRPSSRRICNRSSMKWASLAARFSPMEAAEPLMRCAAMNNCSMPSVRRRLPRPAGLGQLIDGLLRFVDKDRQISRRALPIVLQMSELVQEIVSAVFIAKGVV